MPPKDKDPLDWTADEAKEHITAHEAKHGREMKVPPGQEKKNDQPTQAQFDADPDPTDSEGDDFVEPPDLGEVDAEGDDQ